MKKLKRGGILLSLASLLVLLSGCVRVKNGKPYGMIYDYLAKPMQHFMEFIAQYMGGSYGWSIVVIVIIVRMILLPVMMSQMKKSTLMQERMAMVQPQMRALQARQKKAKTQEEQAAIAQEMMSFYKDNNISMTGGIGCLPLLIQLPIFTALYNAIRYSPELSSATFMGIPLGKPSIILAVLSFLAYLVQSWVSMLGVAEEQKKQMRAMLLMSPIMIGGICLTSSAGLGVYFFIGGLFAILQTILINAYRPRLRKQIKLEMANKPKKPAKPIIETKPVTEEKPTAAIEALKQTKPSQNRRPRNAGKQHHKSQN